MILNFIYGIAIGVANIVPGVSGGTVALIFGIYERIIDSIHKSMSPKNWKNLPYHFLIPLILGGFSGIFLFARLVTFLFDHYSHSIQLSIIGLILGSFPAIMTPIKRSDITLRRILISIISFFVVRGMIFFSTNDDLLSSMDVVNLEMLIFLFVSSALAAGTMIIPGISGSMVLVLLGAYYPIMTAIAEKNYSVICIVMCGSIFGIALFARIISYLLNTYFVSFYFIIIGFVFASIIGIFPYVPFSLSSIIPIAFGFLGFVFAYSFYFFYKK
jgi:putative membrane protein